MPRVSKVRQLSSNKKDLFTDDFYSVVTSLKNKGEVRDFFEDLLTSEEKLMLAKRFQIVMMLKLGYLWKEIQDRVKVTKYTIAVISQRIRNPKKGISACAERIIGLKQKKLNQWKIKRGKEALGPAIVKAGLGVLIKSRERKRKSKSVVS